MNFPPYGEPDDAIAAIMKLFHNYMRIYLVQGSEIYTSINASFQTGKLYSVYYYSCY